jgi:hypothetical protein
MLNGMNGFHHTNSNRLAREPATGEAAAEPVSELSAVISAMNEASVLCSDVADLADRICGPVPEQSAQKCADPEPAGVAPAMAAKSRQLMQHIAAATEAIERIRRVLP